MRNRSKGRAHDAGVEELAGCQSLHVYETSRGDTGLRKGHDIGRGAADIHEETIVQAICEISGRRVPVGGGNDVRSGIRLRS